MMEVMAAKALTPSFARFLSMIAIDPRIDPHKVATIDGLFDERAMSSSDEDKSVSAVWL